MFYKNNCLLIALFILVIINFGKSQSSSAKFGKGFSIMPTDSSFSMKIGLRFQTLFLNEWNVTNDELSSITNHEASLFIRRSRFKVDGWAYSPKLKYKFELALSNRDNGGGNSSQYSNAANIILDAYVEWNFYKTLSLRVGQGKMLGNRERLISSGNMQFVDRSRLNSRFNLDRDVFIMLRNSNNIVGQFVLDQAISICSGEGRNVTSGNIGGYDVTFKLEAFPFGKFASKGAYKGSDLGREDKPKLALAVAYDYNNKAARERGQLGSYISTDEKFDNLYSLKTWFVDMIFKYKGWSVMGEFVNRDTNSGTPILYNQNEEVIGTYYTGNALNMSVGYLFNSNWEVATRYTLVQPKEDAGNKEEHYTMGLSKYLVGHKLKIQSDLTYSKLDQKDDNVMYRMQMDIHF